MAIYVCILGGKEANFRVKEKELCWYQQIQFGFILKAKTEHTKDQTTININAHTQTNNTKTKGGEKTYTSSS